jgi:hypothetical protein|tara:strand:+ start:564 stop:767 length:204 start_codon:yes stop_codon:yes gene_type:complete
MKIVIKEMSEDGNKLLVYLMTDDDIPVKCEMTTKDNSQEVITDLTPEGCENIKTISYTYPENILEDE